MVRGALRGVHCAGAVQPLPSPQLRNFVVLRDVNAGWQAEYESVRTSNQQSETQHDNNRRKVEKLVLVPCRKVDVLMR